MRKIILSPIVVLLLASCTTIQPGSDPIVVNAERTLSTAVDTFDSLFRVEATNHATLKASAPQVVNQVNMLRRNAPKWIESAKTMIAAYKNNRSPENKANLNTAIAVLAAGITQAQQYLTQIGGH